MTAEPQPGTSPRWPNSLKIVVGLTYLAVVAGLLIRFRHLIGPLLLALMLAYLFHPLARALSTRLHLPWRLTVGLLYLFLVAGLIGLLIWGGTTLFGQLQSLIAFLDRVLRGLPAWAADYATRTVPIGPFEIDLSQLDLPAISNQLLTSAQTVLGRLGGLVGVLAGSLLSLLGWTAFVLLISYFILAESGGLRDRMLHVEIPGYHADVQRLGQELNRIWNAFLRGQVLLVLLTILPYGLVMTVLGVRFALPLALMAGLSKFVPYVGPGLTYTTTALVAFFQGSNHWGAPPLTFALLALAGGVLADQIFDNLVAPRVLGRVLGVHPAGILVAAIVAANLFGVIGLLIAAPGLATLKLFSTYAFRKLFDQDPWPAVEAGTMERRPIWARNRQGRSGLRNRVRKRR